MNVVFVDTSAIVAAMNRKDKYHLKAVQAFANLAQTGSILVISNYVRAETHALLLQRAERILALNFLEQKSFLVEWVEREDEKKALLILHRFKDKDFSLTDATSFVIMERLGIDTSATYDRHFSQYGWKVIN